ncbi:hypothetical protein EV382_1388 [Micromonospora violae]|uniref:Uncharacterized protein n=1 Tax=Micromonospora violae TaxID=1278207 RepID=A0A4Q7UB32_9ACTN|nr:hypothetical protein [Micromonospora violae]RZT78206.1 hypothetical protein EV382_1388 [Micromonospora violae]
MTASGGSASHQEQAWPWLWLARLGILLSVINGAFQVVRILTTNATTVTALVNDDLVVWSLATVAVLPLLIGAGIFLYDLTAPRSDFDAFRPERQARRIARLRTGIAFLALGAVLTVAYATVLVWALHR